MPEKIGSRRGSKIGPPLAESGEESFSPSEHMSGFPVTQGPAARFLLRNWGRSLLRFTVTDNQFLLLPILCTGWLRKKVGI